MAGFLERVLLDIGDNPQPILPMSHTKMRNPDKPHWVAFRDKLQANPANRPIEELMEEGGAYIDPRTGEVIPNFTVYNQGVIDTYGRPSMIADRPVDIELPMDPKVRYPGASTLRTNLSNPSKFNLIEGDPSLNDQFIAASTASQFDKTLPSKHAFSKRVIYAPLPEDQGGVRLYHKMRDDQPAMLPESIGRTSVFADEQIGVVNPNSSTIHHPLFNNILVQPEGMAPPSGFNRQLRSVALPIGAAAGLSQEEGPLQGLGY
jgi:hypothetical protein